MGNSQAKKRSYSTKNTVFIPPAQFMTEAEFFRTWHTWKIDFLIFKNAVDKDNHNKQKWGNMLLNFMGPIGQNIHSTFTFNSQEDKEHIDVLLQKFDEYFLFSGRKKLPLENIYEYINDLQLTIKEKNIKNGEKLIKQKILKEIDEHKFSNAAKQVIPSFIFSRDVKELTLKEIAFIWKLYNDHNCGRCGTNHTPKNCPAIGKQCSKCNELNHFSRRCPRSFIYSCNYCGGAHSFKRCPAFNEICTKCKKLNHFSWKCQLSKIIQCHFCNLSHSASRSTCPAKNSICTNCKMIGHFASKCTRKYRK